MKYKNYTIIRIMLATLVVGGLLSCNTNTKQNMNSFEKGTYGYDLELLKKYKKPVELKSGDARVLISPEYQGRVMTSSANGADGISFGWINHDLIASGEVLKQINPVGGEERFWLGPEGGQFSIFFKDGKGFDMADWATPAFLDTEVFEVVSSNQTEAVFTKSVQLKNFSNFEFTINLERKVSLLDAESIKNQLGISYSEEVKTVAYKTVNKLENTGTQNWEKETGLLSIWMLGMYNPSDEVTIIIPYNTDAESDYIVKDDYFGKIPNDRLVVKEGTIFFKGDGKQRGKLGILPERAMPFMGSYDAINKVLTVVHCNIPEGVSDYVNSAWEMQEQPFKGDAINSYNDGPLEDGSQMGPFYELETSSPALQLNAGQSATHEQTTLHFQGSEHDLDVLCKKIFNVSLNDVSQAF